MRPSIRLFLEQPLAEGMTVEPGPASSHYLLHVMRQQAGDEVAVFNGADGEWLAVVEPAGRRRCRLAIAQQLKPQRPEPGPALIFAPLKRSRQEILIEKATELGVTSLQPVLMQRSVVDRLNRERMRAIVIEAAEQCGRLTIPLISLPVPLEDRLAERPPNGPLYVADEWHEGMPMACALRQHGPGDILIGPEGGLAPDERAALLARDEAIAVDLGPRTLRAETAALAALACWQAMIGAALPEPA